MIVIPVYNQLILPQSNVVIPVSKVTETGQFATNGEKVIFLFSKEDTKDYKPDSFYPIGISGFVTQNNSAGFLMIRAGYRVDVERVMISEDGTIGVSTLRREDIEDLEDDADKLDRLKKTVKEYMSRFQGSNMSDGLVDQWRSVSEAVTALGPWLPLTAEERYELLEIDSKKARIEKSEEILYGFLEVAKVSADAQSAQNKEYEQAYREQALKKQIEYLQNEVDKMHPENVSDVSRFEKLIRESNMNDTARGEAEKMLNRMRQEGKNSPEYGNVYDYLDFLTGLNWDSPKAEQIDLGNARKILDEDHFGLQKVKERVIQQIAVMNLKQSQSGSILLFVGAPGTGKTSIASSIAKALNREYVRVSLGGVRDEADIRGHRRTYIGAMPGRIMDGISKSGSSNPVMVLDEIDKLGQSYNGDPASALLEVLDPEQNHTFTDHYMNVPYDLSNVLFVCTANSLDSIPEPLLNRMEVIRFNGYTATDKFQIAEKHLLPKAKKSMGITDDQLIVSDDAVKQIIDGYTMEGGVRGLKKVLDTLCRTCAVKIAEGSQMPVEVTPENLRELLDARPINHTKIGDPVNPGIVTGLAWTAAGGEILFIETLAMKGKGKITVTGQLGDVMKESVSIAVSLVKSLFPEQASFFDEHDIHIHVPEGAVKKDGPSAGVTMTTALSSLITNKAVDPTIGMTGEVSLRGQVMPIGGLPEKLMAAVRAGVKTVLIPKDNVEDLKDVPQEAKDALTIIPVADVQDALKQTKII